MSAGVLVVVVLVGAANGVMSMGWVSLWVGVVVTYDVFIVVFAIIMVTVIRIPH